MSDSLWQGLFQQLQGAQGSLGLYKASATIFVSLALLFPVLFYIDAPHGRASPTSSWARRMCVNGSAGWLLMELVSPLAFLNALVGPPLSADPCSITFWPRWINSSLVLQQLRALPITNKVLATAFLIHYLNRSIVSTLRNPGRSPMHISVPLSAISFNLLNGYLMGVWIGGRAAAASPGSVSPTSSPRFVLGMFLWALGFTANVFHDEILYGLRRPKTGAVANVDQRRYSMPSGGLFSAPFGGISSPSYLCEWIEWIGFAVAATVDPPQAPSLPWPAPWLFVLNEVALMLPRAIKTHAWYRSQFRHELPRRRRAIFPGLL